MWFFFPEGIEFAVLGHVAFNFVKTPRRPQQGKLNYEKNHWIDDTLYKNEDSKGFAQLDYFTSCIKAVFREIFKFINLLD